ncbi:PAS domain S-box protein [Persicitalea jodogahamensis]|uniref:Sensory/regulatory protein RpfC n=1 Tax=Persicitalea jodogahamensis TaxID=402147 RepID=A0A8J3GBR9_9BACT|nr:PAS domain S-box protein [Persicitalea jodogahamensis]GHB79663.1 hypothetical protein GCM10007390_37210 [Persicitalea jodogahamensis]
METQFCFGTDQFNRIFPFHLLIDTSLRVDSCGPTLEKLYPGSVGNKFFDRFRINRPLIAANDYPSLLSLCNQLVILECSNSNNTILRGQFECIDESEALLFIGSPWFDSMQEVSENGLNVQDFAHHDSMLDLLHVLKNQEITNDELRQLLKTVGKQKTELKLAAEEISKIALFPMQNPDPLIRLDAEGNMLSLNPVAEKLRDFVLDEQLLQSDEFWKRKAKQLDMHAGRQAFEVKVGSILYSFVAIPLPETSYFNIYGRDITKQKENENKIELLSLVASANANGVVFTDAKGVITWVNDSYCELTGYNHDEIIGRTPPEIGQGPLSDKQSAKTGMLEPFLAGKKFSVEIIHYRKNGSWFWSRCSGQALFDHDGRVAQYFTMIEDITAAKETQKKLSDFESRFRLMLEKIGDNVWEHDFLAGKTTFSNSNLSLLGISIDEKIPVEQTWWSRVLEEDLHLLIENDRKYKQGEIDFHLLEYRLRHEDGGVRWVLDRGVVIEKDSQGKPLKIIGTHTDLTRQKKAEEELLDTKERLESIFDEMSDIVWSYNWQDSDLLFVSPSAENLFGTLAGTDPIQKDWWEKFVYVGDSESIYLIKDHLAKHGSYSQEYRFLAPDGSLRWVSHSGRIIYDSGQPVRMDGIIRDITERKEAESTIRHEVELQNILIDVSAAYINIDLDRVAPVVQKSLQELGEFVKADRAYIFDYDFIENTTSNLYEWCGEGITPEIENLQNVPLSFLPDWLEVHKKGNPFYVDDVEDLPDSGPESLRQLLEQQNIKSLITLPMLRDGKLIGFVGFDSVRTTHQYDEKEKKLLFLFAQMLLNVNERRERALQLQRQEEKYRNIITNMNLGLVESDSRKKVLFANQSFCLMSGYSVKELLGRNKSEIFDLEEAVGEAGNEAIRTFELTVKNKAGEPRWWFVSEAPNFNDKGVLTGTIGIHLDITEQKNLQRDLTVAKNNAEASTRAKELFLANMSHEIRTPMNAIMGMSNQLGKTSLSSDQKFYLNTINSAAENLLVIINDILDLSKIEAGKLSLEKIGFEPKMIVGRAMHVMMHKAEEKGLAFTNSHCDKRLSPVLIGDPYRMNQILLNLISNAIKFTEKGSVDLSCLVVEDTDTHQTVRISVADTGIGMEEEFVQNLFQKFIQEDSSITRRYGGTGLGMSIFKELVELMDGKIEVQSKKNLGTTISFIITMQKGKSTDLPVRDAPLINTAILAKKRILIVDDNEMNRLVAATLLTNYGAETFEAGNGSGAIGLLRREPIDLVLMDVQMPVMDGIEATRIIRDTISKEIPIIALTAYAIKGDDTRFIASGMSDYLSKPFEENQFIQVISRWLGSDNSLPLPVDIPAPTKELFSLNKLNSIANGNQDFINKMINLFIDQSQLSLTELKAAFEKQDYETIRKVAHRLKPSVDTMEITSLKEKIRELEKFDEHSESFQELGKRLHYLEATLSDIVQKLRER